MGSRFVVIGGDAAGMSAASKARRDAPEMEVVVFERGDWVSYGACGIPYYVDGKLDSLEELMVVDPEDIVEKRGIDLRRHEEIVAIDTDEKTVTVEGADGRYLESYDDLLLATGGRAAMPDVPGTDLEGVFGIRNLEAGRALRHYLVHDDPPPIPVIEGVSGGGTRGGSGSPLRTFLTDRDPETAVVVGANKIGIELAEAFVARDLTVHVVDSGDDVLPAFGTDAAVVAERHLRDAGVTLHLDATLERIRGEGGRLTAIETDARRIQTDVALVDVGVEPNVELAEDAGLELGRTGAVSTDDYGRTSDPDVYAAGDCAEKHHLLVSEPVQWPYALAANRAGRAVGTTVAGTPTSVGGIVGTAVMGAFGVQLSRTGLLVDQARAAGFDPVEKTITTISRAHYYPGWSRIVIHVVADRESERLLGATLAGAEGAVHRINAVATALQAELSVSEVEDLDFGYAPPFGPVWDPVLTAVKALGEELE